VSAGSQLPARRPAEVPAPVPASGRGQRSCLGTFGALFAVLVCLVYIANPTLGTIELIPDMLPFGNLDEAGAGATLVFALGYLLKGRRRK